MKFAMYGSGAAGSVFASYLRKGGADIILIDRYEAHMKKVAEEGMHFTIHQEEDGGYKDYDYQLKGFRTYITAADAAAAEGKVDVIIYMTKATQLEQAIQDSMPVVGDTTVAVSLINGLGNDDNLFKVFPKERCIIGSGVLGTALPEPAHCVSTPAGGVQMNFGGAVRSELTDAACAEMLKCYRDGGCDAYWRDGEPGTDNNIYKFIWKKVCVNATVNTVCAVLRNFFRSRWSSKKKSLDAVAADLFQIIKLILIFHTFCNSFIAKSFCHIHDGIRNDPCVFIHCYGINKTFIDFQGINWKLFQIRKGRISRSKIIQRHFDSIFPQQTKLLCYIMEILNKYTFCNFQFQEVRIQVILFQTIQNHVHKIIPVILNS